MTVPFLWESTSPKHYKKLFSPKYRLNTYQLPRSSHEIGVVPSLLSKEKSLAVIFIRKKEDDTMKIEKLPSGSYRIWKMYQGQMYTVTFDGKPTQKEAMVAMAKELERVQQKHEIMTFKVAYEKYIESKRNVLSPSTIMGYNTIIRQTPKKFLDKRVSDMTALDVQEEINLIAKKCSPKTVRNHHSLISAVLGVFSPNLKLRNCRKIIYAFCLE